VENKKYAEKPKLVEDAELEALLDPCQTLAEFAESLGVDHKIISSEKSHEVSSAMH